MKLNFNLGAVVTLFLDTEARYDSTGMVIAADADEVVIVRQEFVANYEYHDSCGCNGRNLDRTRSVSVGNPVHFDRSKILGWSYFTIPCSDRTTYGGVYKPSDLEDMDPKHITLYNENGVCLGNGEPIDK